MSLPVIFPKVDGPGRLTEICSFRKSGLPDTEADRVFDGIMKIVAGFPISRQNILGTQREDSEISVLVADWTSATDKDVFEPGEQYQSVKPAFGQLVNSANPDFACHHIILPGEAITPDCESYTVSHMRVTQSAQSEVAAAFEEFFSSGVLQRGGFIAVAASREDLETVVCISGGQAPGTNETAEHDKLKKRLDKVVKEGTKYGFDRRIVKKF